MINDSFKVTGDVAIQIFDKDGNLKDTREIKNLVVTVGKEFIASRMVGHAYGYEPHGDWFRYDSRCRRADDPGY